MEQKMYNHRSGWVQNYTQSGHSWGGIIHGFSGDPIELQDRVGYGASNE